MEFCYDDDDDDVYLYAWKQATKPDAMLWENNFFNAIISSQFNF